MAGNRRARGLRAVASALPIAVRRARGDLVALLALVLLAAVACGLAIWAPHRTGQTLDGVAREAVAAAGRDADLLVRSPVGDPSGAGTTAERLLAYAAELPGRLPSELREVARSTSTGVIGPELVASAPDGEVVVRIGVLDPSALPSLEVRTGAPPAVDEGSSAGPVRVMASASGAERLGLAAGDQLVVDGGVERDLVIEIVATAEASDPAGLEWTDLPGLWEEPSTRRDGSSRAGLTVLADAVAFDRIAPIMLGASGTIRTTFAPELFDLERSEAVEAAIDALETSSAPISDRVPFPVVASSGYDRAMADLPGTVAAASAQLSSIAAGPVGAAVLVAVLCGAALARRRAGDILLLRARGASIGLLATHAAAESALVTLLGAALAVAVAMGLGVAVTASALLVAAAAIIALAPVLATALPLLPLPPAARLRAAGLAAGAVLVVAAGAALVALRSGGAPGPDGIDPLAVLAPVLCAAVLAVAVAPATALLRRPAARLAARGRGAGVLLASGAIRDGRSPLALAAVVLATATALSSVVLLHSAAVGQQDGSWRTVGADIRIDSAEDATSLATSLERTGLTVAAVAELDRVEVRGPAGSLPIALLAVDADYPALVAAMPDGVVPAATSEGLRLLGASAADSRDSLAVAVDARLGAFLGVEETTTGATIEVAGTRLPIRVVAGAVTAPGFADGPAGIVDRAALLDAVAAEEGRDAAEESAVASTVLAVGAPPLVADALAAVGADRGSIVLREEVLERRRGAAPVTGATTSLQEALLASVLLAGLVVLVAAALGARRRGRAMALLGAFGAPRRSGLALAAGELVPLVVGGVLGGCLAAAVVLVVAEPAFALDRLVGATATPIVPPWLPACAAAVAALVLALGITMDAPLSRRAAAADILRTGEGT